MLSDDLQQLAAASLFVEDEISSQSSAAEDNLSQASLDSEDESAGSEMPTAKQLLQKEKEIQLSIRGEINIVKKFSTGTAANSNNVKLALDRCRAYLV